MRVAIAVCGYVVGIPLEILIIVALCRGAYRRFPFVFAYAVAAFLASAVEFLAYLMGWADPRSRSLFVRVYWLDEQILLALIYSVVISLFYDASAPLRSRRLGRLAVISFALLFAWVSFLICFCTRFCNVCDSMTSWTR